MEADAQKKGEVEYDSDDMVIPRNTEKKQIEALPPLDHKRIAYAEFAKDFYNEKPEIANMPPAQVRLFLARSAVRV